MDKVQTIIQTTFGNFAVRYFNFENKEIVTFSYGDITKGIPVVRVHSSCLFGESFHSNHCDCQQQLDFTMNKIVEVGCGVIVYVFDEGRGIGLKNKIKAMGIEMSEGLDTVDAFKKLGFVPDLRNFLLPVRALNELNVSKTISFVGGNPLKISALRTGGFEVIETLEISEDTLSDLAKEEKKTKRDKLDYLYNHKNNTDGLVLFYEHKHYELSNFSSHSVEIDGVLFATCEHAYQASKFEDESIRTKIMTAKSSFSAKAVSRTYNDFIRKDWEKIKLSVMEKILRAKVSQHQDVLDSLVNTGDKIIHENSPTDLFWGCGIDLSGESNVGKIWMKIREEVKK